MRILLHACCAVCAGHCIDRLKRDGHELTLFFDNPNIAPPAERARRLSNLRYLAALQNVPLMLGSTPHEAWLERVRGYELEPERGARCARCFALQFELAHDAYVRGGFDLWTTTLTVSRYKSSSQIFEEGRKFAGFLEIDFKKDAGEQKTNQIAKAIGLYRQNYCGCEFSQRN